LTASYWSGCVWSRTNLPQTDRALPAPLVITAMGCKVVVRGSPRLWDSSAWMCRKRDPSGHLRPAGDTKSLRPVVGHNYSSAGGCLGGVPEDRARLAIGSIERNHVPANLTGRPTWIPRPGGPLSVPESNAPRTGPTPRREPQNVPMFGTGNTRSRDRGRMFPFVQTPKSPGAYQSRQRKFPRA
jgi:hypothetical protein